MVDSPYYEKLVLEGILDKEDLPGQVPFSEPLVDKKDDAHREEDIEGDEHPGYGFGV